MWGSLVISFCVLICLSSGVQAQEIECNRPNEEYQCGSACQTTCQNLGEPCPIVNIRCNDACYCVEGYARNGSDSAPCIPQNQCPQAAQSRSATTQSRRQTSSHTDNKRTRHCPNRRRRDNN